MKKALLVALGAAALTFGVAQRADAAIFLSFSDGTTTVSCLSTGVCGVDFAVNPQSIVATTVSVGDFDIGVDASGSFTFPEGQLSSVALFVSRPRNTTANTTLTVLASMNGFTLPPAGPSILSSDGGADFTNYEAGNQYTLKSWVDTTNFLHTSLGTLAGATAATGTCAISPTGGTNPTSEDCATLSAPFTNATPFSLTHVFTYTFPVGGIANRSINSTATTIVTAIPEPASMVLLGTGLLGVATRLRRRTRKS